MAKDGGVGERTMKGQWSRRKRQEGSVRAGWDRANEGRGVGRVRRVRDRDRTVRKEEEEAALNVGEETQTGRTASTKAAS